MTSNYRRRLQGLSKNFHDEVVCCRLLSSESWTDAYDPHVNCVRRSGWKGQQEDQVAYLRTLNPKPLALNPEALQGRGTPSQAPLIIEDIRY